MTLNGLPLDVFEAFVLQAPPEVSQGSVLCIFESAMGLLLPDGLRMAAASDMGRMDLAVLQKSYARHAAGPTSADDNARLSLLVEKSLLILWARPTASFHGGTPLRTHSPEPDLAALRRAVREGIDARDARWKKTKGGAFATGTGSSIGSRPRGRPPKNRPPPQYLADPPGAATLRESKARLLEMFDAMDETMDETMELEVIEIVTDE